jgi:hypothetical protein
MSQNAADKQLQKMIFVMNALNDGWSVKKSQDKYIFSNKHENKVEVFQEEYLATFILQNMRLSQTSIP